MTNTTIQSKRFNLVTLRQSDVTDRYVRWVNNLNNKYITYASQNRSHADIQSYIAERENNSTILFLGIFVRETNEHIGNIKYESIDLINKTAVMGILIGEESWRGLGVAPEVIKSSSEWLNKKFNINQIILGVDSKNIAAVKAYTKIGFKRDEAPSIDIVDKSKWIMIWNMNK